MSHSQACGTVATSTVRFIDFAPSRPIQLTGTFKFRMHTHVHAPAAAQTRTVHVQIEARSNRTAAGWANPRRVMLFIKCSMTGRYTMTEDEGCSSRKCTPLATPKSKPRTVLVATQFPRMHVSDERSPRGFHFDFLVFEEHINT